MDRIKAVLQYQWRADWRRFRRAVNLSRSNLGLLVILGGIGVIRYLQQLPLAAAQLAKGDTARYETLLLLVFLIWLFPVMGESRRSISSRDLLRFPLTSRELFLIRLNSIFFSPLTWIIAAALITIAGVLYGLDKSFRPFNYFQLLLPIFAAAIVGGLGSPVGAIAGGFLVAFSEVAVTYPWVKVAGYLAPGWQPDGLLQLLGTEYKFAVSFVILIVVLLFRPTGLFRGKSV